MEDLTAFVTGGSRGIGAAVAKSFAKEGAHVVVCARDSDALDAVAENIREFGGSVSVQPADVRDEFEIEGALTDAAVEFGSFDVVVACAGVYHGHPGDTPFVDESYVVYDEHLQTNARGVYATIRESIPFLADDARILVPSGGVARKPKPGYGSYAVSKAAAEAIVKGFAIEIDHVVGIVDPGQVTTDLTDEGPGRDPSEVAPMFRWAAVEAPAEDVDGKVVGIREWRLGSR